MSQTEPQQLGNSSMVSQDMDLQNQSVWMAKKTDQHKTKDIDLLQNRILLLRKEEERTNRKIFDTQNKANTILMNKKRNEETNKKKQNNAKHDEEFLTLMQKKSCSLRKAQKEEREAIRMALLDLKREEANDIKRMRKTNSEIILNQKSKNIMEKQKKHDAVVHLVENSRNNIAGYWNERLRFFENQNESTKVEIMRNQQQKDYLMSKLEQEEMELIKRLQYSQDVHINACNQLDKVIQMPASDYETEYGPINPQPAKPKQKKAQQQQKSSFTHTHKKKQYKPMKKTQDNIQRQQQDQYDQQGQQEQYQQEEDQKSEQQQKQDEPEQQQQTEPEQKQDTENNQQEEGQAEEKQATEEVEA